MDDDDERIYLAEERLRRFKRKPLRSKEYCRRNGKDFDQVLNELYDELIELQIKKRLKNV